MTTLDKIPLYGEFNWDDPIYKILRRETASPRFKIFMMKKGMLNLLFYQYTDCKGLKTSIDLDDLFRKQRALLIEEGITTERNEKMKDNMTNHNFPYEDLEESSIEQSAVWCG